MKENSNIITNNSEINNTAKSNTLKNSDSSAGDIISKINKEANALDNEINSSNLKVFEKYHNLSLKELQILLAQKNDNILNLNEKKDQYKKTLKEIINKLNSTIAKNSEYLYDDNNNEDLILNLEHIKEEKIKELENSKKTNKFFKSQYESVKEKTTYGEGEDKKIMNLIEIKINNLRKKNSLIKKEINDIRVDKLKHKKEYELVTNDKKFLHKIKIKTEEMNNFSAQKQGYFSKLNLSMKSLDNIIKEVKRFEEIYNASINEEIDENLVKKINYWMNIIKKDLAGEKDDILSRIENGKSFFLNILNKNNINNNNKIQTELNERYSTNPTSPKVKHNLNNINNETEITENNISLINNNKIESMETQSKLFKNRIIINKNKSSSLILSNLAKGNNTAKKEEQIKFYMKNFGNINSSGNFNYNMEYKTLFRKLNYLKLKSPLNENLKLKLNNINNINSTSNYNSKTNNNLISEEINENPEIILENVLSKDYNQISNSEYRELLVKKEQYLQQNLRLEKNIEEIQKTKNKKLEKVALIIEENFENLINIKNRNNLLKKEIQNLLSVQKLRYEQVKLQSELQINRPNIKKLKIKKEQNKSEEINKLIEINNYYTKKLKERKSNKIDYFNEVFRNTTKIKKNKSTSKSKEKNSDDNDDDNQNREQKLKIIKEKYKQENFDDSNNLETNNNNNNSNTEKEINNENIKVENID